METTGQNDKIDACFKEIKKSVTGYFRHADLSAFRSTAKAKGEIATNVDHDVERLLVDIIRGSFPDHGIIGEEGTAFAGVDDHTWFIDPVDNTVGLVSGEDEVSTSVSLKRGEEHLRSLVINVKTGDVFEAGRDGSFKNGERISTFDGELETKDRAISTCGYVNPVNLDRWHDMMSVLLGNRMPIRISGGAALDLCRLAEGMRAAHLSLGAHPWDVEAGFHIVKAASGVVEILQRFPERNSVAFLASSNRRVHENIKRLLGPLLNYTKG